MDRAQGRNQKAILKALGERPKSVRELAAEVYGKGREEPKHLVGVRKALLQLAKAGFVAPSDVFTREDGSRCWVLANAQVRGEEPRQRHLRQVK